MSWKVGSGRFTGKARVSASAWSTKRPWTSLDLGFHEFLMSSLERTNFKLGFYDLPDALNKVVVRSSNHVVAKALCDCSELNCKRYFIFNSFQKYGVREWSFNGAAFEVWWLNLLSLEPLCLRAWQRSRNALKWSSARCKLKCELVRNLVTVKVNQDTGTLR